MKIVFMGTPDFAATILKAIDEAGHEIKAVYTQPDRPKGRSGALIASPVKEYALSKNIPVYQPERIKAKEEVDRLRTIDADIFVVAAFGQFLSKEILDMPRFGCINAHGSLLPRLRGAAPIQRAIMNGDPETGITVMKMDVGMDSGDIIKKEAVPILDTDNESSMYLKLAGVAAKMVVSLLPDIETGTYKAYPQDPSLVTFAPMINKDEALIDFNRTGREISCQIRGISDWPTAFTFLNGKKVKIYNAKEVFGIDIDIDLEPGAMYVTKKQVFVQTGSTFLELLDLQVEGKKRMKAVDFANGLHLVTGSRFDK